MLAMVRTRNNTLRVSNLTKPKALSITGMALIIPEVQSGAGRHIQYLSPAEATTGLKLNFATQPIYLWGITTVKVSIALFLQRIAPNKTYKKTLWGIIAFLIAYTTACFMTILLQCTNLAILWDPTIKATCWTPTTLRSLSYVNSSKFKAPTAPLIRKANGCIRSEHSH